MDIWKKRDWEKYYKGRDYRSGLRVRYEKNVDPEVSQAIKSFAAWLRKEYKFPKRVVVYVKGDRRIKSMYGEYVCDTFFRPGDRNVEPYARIATGDYPELLEEIGRDNALAAILFHIARELTCYFQWLNDLELTPIGEERQATNYARKILEDYSQTRDHP